MARLGLSYLLLMSSPVIGRLVGLVVAASLVAGVSGQNKDIYPDPAAAHAEIQVALRKAAHEHKRVLLDFGGNWCGDCHALDTYFRQSPNAELLKKNFVLVDVNIGRFDKNLDIAKGYEVPLEKGVPALAVLDAKGHVLFSQKNGEFEAMRSMEPGSVTEFLNRWKK
jgi:thiol:disulfide interchange protein